MGGGDVKLLAGIALVQPVYEGMIFVLAVLLVAAVSASIVLCLYYVGGFLLTKPKIKWNTSRKRNSGILILVSAIILSQIIQTDLLSFFWVITMALALILGVLFYAFEDEVKKHSFLKRISISELEDDEVLAVEHLTKEEKEKWGKDIPNLVGTVDVKGLQHRGLTQIPVYRNLPKFAPFLLLGILLVYSFPSLVSEIVPSFL
jgi:prepilin signal peptidase PulO-like enzyme (type II secretory pathway)